MQYHITIDHLTKSYTGIRTASGDQFAYRGKSGSSWNTGTKQTGGTHSYSAGGCTADVFVSGER